MTQRRWVIVLTAFIGAMMGSRLLRWPLEVYGDAAAQYIEHLTRLRMLERIREGLPSGPLEALKALEGIYPPGLRGVELAWGAVRSCGGERALARLCVVAAVVWVCGQAGDPPHPRARGSGR